MTAYGATKLNGYAMKQLLSKISSKSLLASIAVTASLLTASCGGGGDDARNIEIPGVDGPVVTLDGDNVRIDMIFENLQIDGGIQYRVPKYKNSLIEISPDLQSAGTLMAISVSLDDVFGGDVGNLDPMTLPGGRPLPGVSGGSLPAVAFSIEEWKNMGFYLGPKVFGVFIPVNGLGLENSILSYRFYSKGDRVGNIALVGADENGKNSGFLLMLDMSGWKKNKLQKLAKKY